jgi:hypothetical protein
MKFVKSLLDIVLEIINSFFRWGYFKKKEEKRLEFVNT